jgi:signal transduction histidine kinase
VRTLDDLRHLALDLRPAVLDDHGLVAAVRWLIETDESRYGLRGRLELGGGFGRLDQPGETARRLPPPVETALFRIVQEALANAGKHAHAKRVTVRLLLDHDRVGAEVEDDGIGLPEAVEPDSPPGHMGLFNMRERATLLGGTCVIEPGAAGCGTLVWVRIPITMGAAPSSVERVDSRGHDRSPNPIEAALLAKVTGPLASAPPARTETPRR